MLNKPLPLKSLTPELLQRHRDELLSFAIPGMAPDVALAEKIDDAVSICHGLAYTAGWYHDAKTGELKDRNDGEMIALIHSELSEALEGLRKDKDDDHLPAFKSVEVELADTVIRIFDMCGARGYRIGDAMAAKLAYNAQRADHKLENRMKEDGKKF